MTSLVLLLGLGIQPASALPLYERAVEPDYDDFTDASPTPEGIAFWTDNLDRCKPKRSFDDTWTRFSAHIDTQVTVFVAANAATVYNANPGNSTRQITQIELEQRVLSAMEVWNRESRGPVLVWGGRSWAGLADRDELNTTCALFEDFGGPGWMPTPDVSVLVGGHLSSTSAGQRAAKDINGDWCSDSGHHVSTVFIGSRSHNAIRESLVHEFGHVLGLAHSFGDYTDPGIEQGPMSVMQYDINHYNNAVSADDAVSHAERKVHLWPYDRDCVDDDLHDWKSTSQQEDGRVRRLRYNWRTYDPTGSTNHWGSTVNFSFPTAKSSIGSGLIEEPYTGDDWASVLLLGHYSSPYAWAGDANQLDFGGSSADSAFSFQTYMPWDASGLDDTPISPVVLPLPDTSYRMSNVVYALEMTGAIEHTDVAANDPPVWRIDSSVELAFSTWNDTLEVCTASPCDLASPTEPVKSHVSLRTAFDLLSGNTILSKVRTRSCDGACGAIDLHVGTTADVLAGSIFNPADPTRPDGLALPAYTAPGSSGAGGYDGTTHVSAAVACADRGAFNCMVAWVDFGNNEGHVLAARFEISGTSIIWEGSAQLVAPTSTGTWTSTGGPFTEAPTIPRSQSDLSMAYVDGRFMLAFKSSMPGYEDNVAVARMWRWGTTWERLEVFVDDKTIEAPALIADLFEDQREAVLTWSRL